MMASSVYVINGSERSCCNASLCFSPFAPLLKGEHAMKDQDFFSHEGSPPTPSAQQRGRNSEGHAPSSPSTLPQDTPSLAHLPRMGRRLTERPRMRLLLV